MLRVVASIVALPVLLVAFLLGAMSLGDGKFGSVSAEIFEMGILPVVVLAALAVVFVFLPLWLLASRFRQSSMWAAVVAGLISALIPVLFSAWPVLADSKRRVGFRVGYLAESYPWLVFGALAGLVFWLMAVFRNRALPERLAREP